MNDKRKKMYTRVQKHQNEFNLFKLYRHDCVQTCILSTPTMKIDYNKNPSIVHIQPEKNRQKNN